MRAADTTKNSEGLYEKIKSMPKKKLYSLRINHMTTIFVPKEKCNEKYRQEYINRMNFYVGSTCKPRKVENSTQLIDIEILKKMYLERHTIRDMAKHFGVSNSTIHRYIQENKGTWV